MIFFSVYITFFNFPYFGFFLLHLFHFILHILARFIGIVALTFLWFCGFFIFIFILPTYLVLGVVVVVTGFTCVFLFVTTVCNCCCCCCFYSESFSTIFLEVFFIKDLKKKNCSFYLLSIHFWHNSLVYKTGSTNQSLDKVVGR